MEDVDTQEMSDRDEDDLFVCDVCSGDHELLFLDSYLKESFGNLL